MERSPSSSMSPISALQHAFYLLDSSRHLFYTPLMAGTVSPSSLGHSRVLGHSHTLSHTRAASTSAEDVEDSYPQWMAAWLDPNTPHKLFKTCEGQDAVTGDGTDQNSSVVEGLRL